MRTALLFWLLILTGCVLFSQTAHDSISFPLRQNSFYIICRGTKQKMGFIAEKFNISDKNITHVGIGIVENGKLFIYNVMNTNTETTALLIQTPEAFTAIPDIFYFSAWECRSSENEIEKLKTLLQSYSSKPIAFDLDFNELDDDKLYCSEFCAKVLHRFNPEMFGFALRKKKLDFFYSRLLKRKTLRYYPVDFFETNTRFHKIYETHY